MTPLVWKHQEIVPDPAKPFAEDVLGREVYADNLSRLVESTQEPIVLSVNGAWGAGKTTFLRMWRHKLQSAGHHTLFFDAWKNDFVEDPLVALISELEKEIRASEALTAPERNVGGLLQRIREIGAGALRRSAPVVLRVATGGIVDAAALEGVVGDFVKELSAEASEVAEERIAKYEAEKSAMESFRTALQDLSSALAKQTDKPSQIVVFIDELDRCRPDFALVVLERVKHLFAVPGFVFVLGLDAAQLAASVRAIYGAGFAAEGYLRRFIDIEFNLPAPNARGAVEYFANQANLREALATRSDAQHARTQIIEVFTGVFEQANLPLRTQQQCFTQLNLALRTWPLNENLEPVFVALLILLKTLNRQLFSDYVLGRAGAEDVLSYFSSLSTKSPFEESNLEYSIEGYFYGYSQKTNEYARRIAGVRAEIDAANEGGSHSVAHFSDPRLRALDWYNGRHRLLKSVVQRIELAEKFSD